MQTFNNHNHITTVQATNLGTVENETGNDCMRIFSYVSFPEIKTETFEMCILRIPVCPNSVKSTGRKLKVNKRNCFDVIRWQRTPIH